MKLATKLQRKDPRLPMYVVPGRYVQPWNLSGTTIIEGTANGLQFGRRTIKALGKGADGWFVEFTSPFCKAANLSVGDPVSLRIRLADTSTPQELKTVLSESNGLEVAWSALSERERRVAAEHIRAAKTRATRERRATAIAEKLRADAKL